MDLNKLKRPPAIAAKFGVTLIIMVALYSSVLLLRTTIESFADGEDYASSYQKRFQVVKRLLPERGTIGFRSDAGGGDWFMANYALSPILVEYGVGPRVYLLNLTRDKAASVEPERPGEYSVRHTAGGTVYDFGGGVMLVERDSR